MAKGISLHLGLNKVDPDHYDGWDGALGACEADAEDMAAIAAKQGFSQSTMLLTTQATYNRVLQELESAAANADPGDLFMLTYSGHGGQLPDLNRDENDLADETWCLYDRQFVDDHLYKLLGTFQSGVRIVVLSDSCHSGTMIRALRRGIPLPPVDPHTIRAMPPDIGRQVYRKNKELYDSTAIPEPIEKMLDAVRASVILISGCQDNQYSLDGPFNGMFTGTLLQVWQGGRFQGSYRRLHSNVVRLMPATQSPNFFTVGAYNPDFEGQQPFTVNP